MESNILRIHEALLPKEMEDNCLLTYHWNQWVAFTEGEISVQYKV